MNLWPFLIFVAVAGACVGSFLNVVICRLPQRQSVVHPPSRCPQCEHRLAWYDNVPVLSWLWLRGRCRYCRTTISIDYPLIEALSAFLFVSLFCVYYLSSLRPEFSTPGLAGSWPVLGMHLILVGALIGATRIDALEYIIPLSISWTVIAIAFGLIPLAAWQLPATQLGFFMPPDRWVGPALGAVVGLIVANLLLRLGWIPLSFREPTTAEPELTNSSPDETAAQATRRSTLRAESCLRIGAMLAAATAVWFGSLGLLVAVIVAWMGVLVYTFDAAEHAPDPEQWFAHPHPRREVLKELLFMLPVALGITLGAVITWGGIGEGGPTLAAPLRAVAGVAMGLIAGGAIVWLVRIFGTLAFGREAMGLGDVHLMAAIGVVLGPIDVLVAFFIAPFIGLAYVLSTVGLGSLLKKRFCPIPYGPHLALACVIVMIFRLPLLRFLGII